jgi:hypothetical protein
MIVPLHYEQVSCSLVGFHKQNKPFYSGEYVRKYLQHTVQESVFNNVSLCHATMMQQVEDVSSDLLSQLKKQSKKI